MKNYFALLTDLTDNLLNSSKDSDFLTSNFHNFRPICPSAFFVKRALLNLSSSLNIISDNYKSEDTFDRSIKSLEQAFNHIDKALYDVDSFCLSLIDASNMYQLTLTYDKVLDFVNANKKETLQELLLKYIDVSYKKAKALKPKELFMYGISLHAYKYFPCQEKLSILENLGSILPDCPSIENQVIYLVCDIYKNTKDSPFENEAFLVKAKEKADSLLFTVQPDNSLLDRNGSSCLSKYISSFFYLVALDNDERYKKVLHYILAFLIKDDFLEIFKNPEAFLMPSFILLNRNIYDMQVQKVSQKEAFSDFNGIDQGLGLFKHGNGSNLSSTIITNSPDFYVLQEGDLKLRLRLNATFFGPKGRFESKDMVVDGNQIFLNYNREWGYFLPLEDKSINAIDGIDINKKDRTMTTLQTIDMNVKIELLDQGADITIDISGVDDLACKLDLVFDKQGYFNSDSCSIFTQKDDHIQLQRGAFTYCYGKNTISVSSAFEGRAKSSRDLRGSLAPVEGAFTVYFTDMTPCSHTISIRGGKL